MLQMKQSKETVLPLAPGSICLSVGILAWNEEESIEVALESLFEQSVFAEVAKRNLRAEVLVLANGCTDRTVPIVNALFAKQVQQHPFREAIVCRCHDIQERGRNHSWNLFIHKLSAPEVRCLYLMDGDIVFRHPDTIWNLYCGLENNPHASIASDEPIKDSSLKLRKTWRDRLSIATSRMNSSAHALMTGQLYCIRADVARNIYLPKDLVACEDGLIRALACSEFLAHEVDPTRLIRVPNASHVFEAYTSPSDVIKNQKRQIIGQTIVHIIVDQYLPTLPAAEREKFAAKMQSNEKEDPDWLKRLISEHLRRARFFWRLFPGLLTFRFQRLARLRGAEKIRALPAAFAGFFVTMISAWMAWRFLARGYTDYWPLTRSNNLRVLKDSGPEPAPVVSKVVPGVSARS